MTKETVSLAKRRVVSPALSLLEVEGPRAAVLGDVAKPTLICVTAWPGRARRVKASVSCGCPPRSISWTKYAPPAPDGASMEDTPSLNAACPSQARNPPMMTPAFLVKSWTTAGFARRRCLGPPVCRRGRCRRGGSRHRGQLQQINGGRPVEEP